jgi:hypothetical protein
LKLVASPGRLAAALWAYRRGSGRATAEQNPRSHHGSALEQVAAGDPVLCGALGVPLGRPVWL